MKRVFSCCLAASIICSLAHPAMLVPAVQADETGLLPLLITEVLPDPSLSPENQYEWLEIHNTSDQQLIVPELTVTDAQQSDILKNIVIPALGYHLIAGSSLALPSVPTDTVSLITDARIGNGLANTGDRVSLIDSAGRTIDSVDWGNQTAPGSLHIPAPKEGHSLHRVPSDVDTDSAADFIELDEPTPEEGEDTPTPPPDEPGPQPIGPPISAPVDPAPVTEPLPDAEPPAPIGLIVYPYDILLNEFLPAPGSSTDWDENGTADSQDEWIELVNLSVSEVDLSGWFLDDEDGGSQMYTLPKPTLIPAHGFLTLFKQDTTKSTGTHLILNNTDDCVRLLSPDLVVKDEHCYQNTSVDRSYARDPFDLTWRATDLPTPSAANMFPAEPDPTADPPEGPDPPDGPSPLDPPLPVTYPPMLINELMPAPSDTDWDGNGQADQYDEWIEILNPGSAAVDLQDWQLQIVAGSTEHVSALPAGTVILPAGFFTLYRLDTPERTGTHLALNNTAACVRLLDPHGDQKDEVCYEEVKADQSYARFPSATTLWSITELPTPGAANQMVLAASDTSEETENHQPGAEEMAEDDAVLPLMTIAGLKKLPDGTRIHTTGLVTALPGLLGKDRIYIQDADGTGIAVELTTGSFPDLYPGDRVEVSSTIETKYGEQYIRTDAVTVLESDIEPAATRIATGSIDEATIGRLVTVRGTIVSQSGSTFSVDDGSGIVNVVLKASAGIVKPSMKKGNHISVTGIASRYWTASTNGEGYRILPRFQSDIRYGLATTGPQFPYRAIAFLLTLQFGMYSLVRARYTSSRSYD